MKKKIYLILIILFILTTSASFYFISTTLKKLQETAIQSSYQNRIKEYNSIVSEKKIFLDAFSGFISHAKPVIDGYLNNNREEIIKFLNPLYKNLSKKHLIKELHFFKKPAISFVNFSNLQKYNFDVSQARQDIILIESSFTPSTHFYICRVYPGFRATYPIIYKDRLLGAVSFGIDLSFFKHYFKNLGVETSLYLNDNNLQKFLLPTIYQKYTKLPLHQGFRIDGEYYNIDLNKKYVMKKGVLYTIISITDLFGNHIAYLVIKDDLNKYLNIIKSAAKKKITAEIITYLTIFIFVILLFHLIFQRLNSFHKLFQKLKENNFSHIPPQKEPKDEFDIYENNILEMAQEIKSYLSLLKNEVEKYQDKAYIDGLTKVFNRMFLEENKKEFVLKAKIQNKDLSVIMLDIDNFKKINDNYGHDIGDLVLVELAKTIKSCLRENDYLIRYGGEEFVIILYLNITNTLIVAEKIRKKIEDLKIYLPNNKTLKFTISLGVSHLFDNEDCLCSIIKRADEKLYKAKKNGKNQVQI